MSLPQGVLILHGFTASRATVAPIVPRAEALGLAWSLPQLRGHWTKPEDLVGVTYENMLHDALTAFDKLRSETSNVAVVGLSVGGLIALDVASRRQGSVAALVVLAPALRFVSPLTRFTGLLSRVMKTFTGKPDGGFSDPSYAVNIDNYTSFPTATFLSIYQAVPKVEARLKHIIAPTLVLAARNDRVIQPAASQMVYDKISARHKEIVWYERSGHEMLVDCEGESVANRVQSFLQEQLGIASAAALV